MSDEAVQDQIRREFHELCLSRGRARERGGLVRHRNRSLSRANATRHRNSDMIRQKNFQLQFAFAGKPFATVLQAKCENVNVGALSAKQFTLTTKSLQEKRPCIYISITIPPTGVNLTNYIENELHEFDSMISANDPANRCFHPVLEPNRTNPNVSLRFSSADVLQTLKTKLQYLLPNPHGLPIQIQDAATTKFVALTPFHVLRGDNPFYFKYGFQYRNLQAFQDTLPSVNWGSLRFKFYFEDITFEQRIFQITNKRYSEDTPILRLLREIPFDLESAENERFIMEKRPDTRRNLYNDLSLSLSLLRSIAKDQGYTDAQLSVLGGEGNIFLAVHDPTSPEWLASSRRLVLAGFRPSAEGGKRKTRRQTKYLSR